MGVLSQQHRFQIHRTLAKMVWEVGHLQGQKVAKNFCPSVVSIRALQGGVIFLPIPNKVS